MFKRMYSLLAAGLIAAAMTANTAMAQSITLPTSGNNQKASVTQQIGPIKVTIDYSSPHVHAPDGTDRHGKIWGGLVPYGLVNLGFGTCKECPWRAGANENTTFTVSHDVKIEGKLLPAGSYGFFIIPGPEEWTLIFSKNHTSWGSFFYDPAEDALRVKVKTQKNPYHEVLTYEFIERKPDMAVAMLMWEDLAASWTISVDDIAGVYVAAIRNELRSSPGFESSNWRAAAEYCLQNKTNLKEALTWAQTAIDGQFVGQENFQTLMTLSKLQDANGMKGEAEKTSNRALNHPTASAIDLHQFARQLQTEGNNTKAFEVFRLNAKLHPNQWPVNVGLMRAYAGTGDNKNAIKYAKLALIQAPDDLNKKNLSSMIEKLEKGEKIN